MFCNFTKSPASSAIFDSRSISEKVFCSFTIGSLHDLLDLAPPYRLGMLRIEYVFYALCVDP